MRKKPTTIERACARCGAPFTLTAPRQTYCTDPCRLAARREYIAATMRNRRNGQAHPPVAKRPHSNRVDIICEVCGGTKSKPASQAKAPRQYCGAACRNKGQERPVDLVCLYCGNPFQRPASLAHRQFCKNQCRAAFRADDDIMERLLNQTFRAGLLRYGAQCLIRPQRICTGGYSTVDWRGDTALAHRVIWILAHGPVPEGLEVSHLCHTPNCIEIAHLIVETHAENMERSRLAGRFKRKVAE